MSTPANHPPEWKCPRCTQSIAPAAESCPHCGYTLAVTDEVFGGDAVLLERVTDAAGVLSATDIERVTLALVKFEEQFPQLFAAVYCGALPAQTSLRQFGFWLLNRAAVPDLDAARANENGALLVVDVHGRCATVVPGYFLECYLEEKDLLRVLEAGRKNFQRGLWADGLCASLRELSTRVRRRAGEAAKSPERFAPPRPPAEPAVPSFKRLREGHRRGKNIEHQRRE